MHHLLAICAALVLYLTVPVSAGEETAATQETEATSEETHEAKLDRLFGELKRERNERAAKRISDRIWEEWSHSGSATIDLMMQWSQSAADKKQFDVALDFLDQVTTLSPTFAEGWNRRATIHFLMNNYSMSMADIDRTLQLEPRHFGALSGMAQILKNTGRDELALNAYLRVLDIYPMNRSAQTEVGSISEEIVGEGI